MLVILLQATASAAPATYTLSLDNKNLGIIMVTPRQASYEAGQEVTIIAATSHGKRFSSWTGDVMSSSNPLTFVMDSDKSISYDVKPQEEVPPVPGVPQASDMPRGDQPIVYLLGDSITHYYYDYWQADFPNYKVLNLGRGGYQADHIYDHILMGGNLHYAQVSCIFIMAGINDLFRDRSTDKEVSLASTITDHQNIINRIREHSDPDTKIFIQSVLPVRYDKEKVCDNSYIEQLNESLTQLADENNATFINLYDLFYDPENGNNYTHDGVHLTWEGYDIWVAALAPYLPDTASDSDGDGLPDSWEMDHFDTLDYGPADDPDADGSTNLQEYNAGTDPNDLRPAAPMGLRIVAVSP